MKIRCIAFTTFLFLFFGAYYTQSANVLEDFEGWTYGAGIQDQTQGGWFLDDGFIKGPSFETSIPPTAAWLINNTIGFPDSSVRTPMLPNGAGTITFDTASSAAGATFVYYIQTGATTNGPWGAPIAAFTNTYPTAKSWSVSTYDLNSYSNICLRFSKALSAGNAWAGLDNILITDPPAKVVFGTPDTDPGVPRAAIATHVFCTLTTNLFATITGVTLSYDTGNATGTNTMGLTGYNLYKTDNPIPAVDLAGHHVDYQIDVTFSGPSATPTNITASYISDHPTYDSSYASIDLIGSTTAPMELLEAYLWGGIASLPTTNNAGFQFQGVHTNGTTTNVWGDIDQGSTTFIVYGTAGLGEEAFTIDTMPAGTYWFEFDESTNHYFVNTVTSTNFDGWTSATSEGSYNANGWDITGGRVASDGPTLGALTCYLGDSGTASIRSPELTNGIGNISFQLSHFQTNATPTAECRVQISATGGTSPAEWSTIDTLTVEESAFNRFTIPFSTRDQRYVRILNTTATNGAEVAIDDFMIAAPGAGVSVSNLIHDPSSPFITNEVTVAVDLTPYSGATLQSVQTLYRYGTNATFTAINMSTNTASGHYETDSVLPRDASGLVQYYVELTYLDPVAQEVHYTYEPQEGASNPRTYTNTDEFAAATYIEESEGWQRIAGPVFQTNSNGWDLSDSTIRDRSYGGTTTIEAAFLWNLLIGGAPRLTNSYLMTPELPFGAGIVSFEAYNNNTFEADPDIAFQIQSSTNGSDWQVLYTLTNTGTKVWNTFTNELHIENPIYLRFFKHEVTESGRYLGLDNIEITYPVARVAISNVAFHPLYPADSDPVNIACDITSLGAFSPALNITARVYHKRSTDGSFTAPPIEMVNNDGDHFITSTNIPAYGAGDTIEYYIESTFGGYNRIIAYSPTVSPSGAPSERHSYLIRSHESNYETLIIGIGAESITMRQVDNSEWVGIMSFLPPEANIPIEVQGLNFYDGTNLNPGVATTWGDSDPGTTNLPYSGIMDTAESSLTIPGNLTGQYILAFNEQTGRYTLRRGVYQDFNSWISSRTYFTESANTGNPKEYDADFSNTTDWPATAATILDDDFDSVANSTNYPLSLPPSFPVNVNSIQQSDYYTLYQSLVVTQLVGQAAMLHPTVNYGWVRTDLDFSNDGVGNFEFDVRCVNDELAPATYDAGETNIIVEASIKADAIPENESGDSLGFTYKSILACYVDDDNYYELRMIQFTETVRRLELWEKNEGELLLRKWSGNFAGKITTSDTMALLILYSPPNTLSFRGFLNGVYRVATYLDDTPITNSTTVGLSGMDADLAINSVTIFGTTNLNYGTDDLIYYENFEGGTASGWNIGSDPWTVTNGYFKRPGYTGVPLSFTVDYIRVADLTGGVDDDPGSWITSGTYTNYANSDYIHITHPIERPEDLYVRVRHTSGNGSLIIDNPRAESWHGYDDTTTNGWQVSEAWMRGSRQFELRTSRAYTNEVQYIRSPLLTNGIGTITFDYKATSTSNELVFAIRHTNTAIDPNNTNDWSLPPVVVVTNAPLDWTQYVHQFPEGSNAFSMLLRIENISSDWDSGMLIRNILIAAPIPIDDLAWRGYNALITDEEADKLLPEDGNVYGGYLNNTDDVDTAGVVYSNNFPYIESASVPDGIGEIQFAYRAWNGTPTQIDIVAATNRLQSSEWTLLHSITNITNQTFQVFDKYFYDRDHNFVRLRVNTDEGHGRACVDNIMIAAPFAATLKIRNVTLVPEVPFPTDEVRIRAQVYDEFLAPSNIILTAYFQEGTNNWGAYNSATSIEMPYDLETDTYGTTIPFGPDAIDTVVQYYVQAEFDGLFSEISSPLKHKTFTNPEYYLPKNYNTGETNPTPYYVVFSCLTNQVWINELNIKDRNIIATQYVEVVGLADINIGNWKLEIMNVNEDRLGFYEVPPSTTLQTETNGFGFFVFGTNSLATMDLELTNTIPDDGAARLYRSMGAEEHSICFGQYDAVSNLVALGYQYAGEDQAGFATKRRPLVFIGEGSNVTDFAWAVGADDSYSPGLINIGQTLVPWPSGTNGPLEGYQGALAIGSFWTTETQIHLVVAAESNNLTMTPWYSTNLPNAAAWTEGANAGQSNSVTTYTVWCDLVTNAPGTFYKVTTP